MWVRGDYERWGGGEEKNWAMHNAKGLRGGGKKLQLEREEAVKGRAATQGSTLESK